MRHDGRATSTAETLAQREHDHQRWADDGGPSPEPCPPVPPVSMAAIDIRGPVHSYPLAGVCVAAALGFACGWITWRR
ncbi:MAG: hypothetical protein JWO38_817 [Gemmataceae bacterium]|nr:hypothetical protein [Gemmataceae bacterium]